MNSVYHSFTLYSRHHILLRPCSPLAKTMSSSFSHLDPSTIPKKQRKMGSKKRDQAPRRRLFMPFDNYAPVEERNDTSVPFIEEEANGTTVEVGGSKHKGTSVVDLDYCTNLSYTPSKDGSSFKRNHRYSGSCNRRRHDLSSFDICSSVPKRYETGIKDGILEEEANVGTVQVSNKHRVLRPGMVLLKDFLTHHVQVDIVKSCRELGVKPTGFYQPGYRVGSKLHLQMMCLGRNWNPQTKYGKNSDIDIPDTFSVLVEQAIREAHALIDREDADKILPVMSPDICIVNFYSETGRLGLHQDRDESRESIIKGLPIVSFSIGDSAEFLYGEKREVEEAERVILETGDVLIFGGESRMIFHGVKSIIPNSAPMSLLNESKLRPGRLNLTFRHF